MDVNRDHFVPADLARLMIKLEEVLKTTTRTKKTLSTSFESVKKLLNGWYVPDTFSNQEPLECTCYGDEEDEKEKVVNDVAKNVEEIVVKAQKIREQWISSSEIQPKKPVTKQNIPAKPSLKQPVHSSNMKKINSKDSKKIEKDLGNKQNLNSGDNTDAKKIESKLPVSKKSMLNGKISLNSLKIPKVVGKSRMPVLRSQSKSTSSLKTTYQNDFVQQPLNKSFNYPKTKAKVKKHNVEPLKNTVSLATQLENKKQYFPSGSGKLEMAQLDELLSRVTNNPNTTLSSKNNKMKESQLKVSKCLIHSDDNVQSLRCVGLEEAVDTLGVPHELVKVLKTYHSFLSVKSSYITSKGQSSASSFTNKLSEMNDHRLKNVMYEPLVGMCLEYFALSAQLLTSNSCSKGISNFNEKLQELEIKFRKWSNLDESAVSNSNLISICEKESSVVDCVKGSAEGWDLVGVWHANSRKRIQVLEKIKCMNYNSKGEWKKYDAILQDIQRIDFQLEMFDIIEKTIFPRLHKLDSRDPVFVALFKTVCTLCNMTRLRPPLVIKSL